MSIVNETAIALAKVMKEGEESFIEFVQSDIHTCEEMKNNNIIFFTTRDDKFKMIENSHPIFAMPISHTVKCCIWCGFRPNEIKH